MTQIQHKWKTYDITSNVLRKLTIDMCNEEFKDENIRFFDASTRRIEFKVGASSYRLYKWDDEPKIIETDIVEDLNSMSDEELLETIKANRVSDELLDRIFKFVNENIFYEEE